MRPKDLGLPAMVSWARLWGTVRRFTGQRRDIENSLRDLWQMGAPDPNMGHGIQKRVLLAGRFERWWEDYAEGVGAPHDRWELEAWKWRH